MLNEDAFVSALDIIARSYEINDSNDTEQEKEKIRLFLWFFELLDKEIELYWRKYGDILKIKLTIIMLDFETKGYSFMIEPEDYSGHFLSQRPNEEFWESFEFVKNVIKKKPKFSFEKVKSKNEDEIIYELELKK